MGTKMKYYDPDERRKLIYKADLFCREFNWRVSELARAVGIPYPTLRAWIEKERIPSEQFKTMQQMNALNRFLKSKGYAK